jgi:uncharacterized protein (UPF0335 family)
MDDIQDAAAQSLTQAAKEKLKQLVSRIERLEEDKKVLSDEIKDTFAGSKAEGYDVKALRAVIKLRKIETAERQEQEAILDLYLHALGEI